MNELKPMAGIPLPQVLQQAVTELGFTQFTPIQQQVIPLIQNGQDVAAQAQTGSGKTAAYGIPVIQRCTPTFEQVQALIIVPTRELALQVQKELKKLGKYISMLKIATVYGGHSFREEQNSFKHPPQILIATPGRLLDHLQRNTFQLENVAQLVLDEADKLLEMGFEEELNQIVAYLPEKRQSLLFSATLPDKVLHLISKTLVQPRFVTTSENANPEQIGFTAFRVTADRKLEALLQLLSTLPPEKTVVFCNTREGVNEIVQILQQKGYSAIGLHGAMEQVIRDQAITKFRNGSVQLLVATDLAARGLHIEELNVIIHLEILREEASFLHRSGRTGRAGQSGKVYILVSQEEEKYMQAWKQTKNIQWQKLPAPLPARTGRKQIEAPEFITLHFKAGKKEKLSARDIVGVLIAEAQLQASQIGKIEIYDHFSYVAVPFQLGNAIVEKLNQVKIKGKKIRITLVK